MTLLKYLRTTLETVGEWGDWTSPADLGELLDISESTASNYLATCWKQGYLDCRVEPPRKGPVKPVHRRYRMNMRGALAVRT